MQPGQMPPSNVCHPETFHFMKFVVTRRTPTRTTLIRKIPPENNFHPYNSHSRSFPPKQFPPGQFLPNSCPSGSCPRTDMWHRNFVSRKG